MPQRRRASDVTASRLGLATLAYLTVMMGIITLAPFRFDSTPVHGLTSLWTWSDLVMNVVMFLPFGFVFQLTRPTGAPASTLRVLLYGALLSGCVETAQLFEATRFSSLFDVATNAMGATLGAMIYRWIVRAIEGENAVRTLALELPLMALLYLLVPLMWLIGLASGGDSRSWLVLPITAFAGGIMGTVHAAYLQPSRGIARGWLLPVALLWFVVAMLPGTIRDPALLASGALLTVSTAWLRSIATARFRDRFGNRRFELPTLRLVMPLFAAYLALSSLWPLDEATASWRSAVALYPAGVELSERAIYLMLEHIAAFTLVGYIVAEFYGRDLARYRQVAPRVVAWGGGISLLLEATRGWHPLYGASLSMLIITVAACAIGGWLYQLQREHVKALLTRRTRATNDARATPSAAFSGPVASHQHPPTLDRRTA